MKKYFDEPEEEIRGVYIKLNKVRQKIIHSNYTDDEVFEIWKDTFILKTIVADIIKTFLKYPKSKFNKLEFKEVIRAVDKGLPKIIINKKS